MGDSESRSSRRGCQSAAVLPDLCPCPPRDRPSQPSHPCHSLICVSPRGAGRRRGAAHAQGISLGLLKLVFEKPSGRILGVHILVKLRLTALCAAVSAAARVLA